MRPESITIHLLRNGEEIKTKTVTEADDWKWTFDNLDKFDANDKEYKYTIKEDTVPFYTSAESTDADGNTVITNTYKPEKLELKGDAALKVTKVVVGKKSAEDAGEYRSEDFRQYSGRRRGNKILPAGGNHQGRNI